MWLDGTKRHSCRVADVVLLFWLPSHSIRINDPSPLGAGGFGAVWRANWQGREVAIKVRVACASPELFFHHTLAAIFVVVNTQISLHNLRWSTGCPKAYDRVGKGERFRQTCTETNKHLLLTSCLFVSLRPVACPCAGCCRCWYPAWGVRMAAMTRPCSLWRP